ncbi:MAG: hotdog fold thioesterase [Bacteroidales bacterium]|nr:hotdog fold thioesterase [Bacteroidales bacterium]
MDLISVETINELCRNSLIDHLGIVITEISEYTVRATMPVDHRTKQPLGLLHGGAVMALAETVGSLGSYNLVNPLKFDVVGMEINGNHIGNTKSSHVYAVARLIHRGRITHVWSVDIFDGEDTPISICRITNMVLEKNGKQTGN